MLHAPPSLTPLQKISDQAQAALEQSPIYLLRLIRVTPTADVLRLTGRVDTFYHKQMAQEVVRSVADGVQVVNAVRVD